MFCEVFFELANVTFFVMKAAGMEHNVDHLDCNVFNAMHEVIKEREHKDCNLGFFSVRARITCCWKNGFSCNASKNVQY